MMNIRNATLVGHGLHSPGGKPFRLFILDTLGKLFGIMFHVEGIPFGGNPHRYESEQSEEQESK